MEIGVFSDLHLEFDNKYEFEINNDADVFVFAGDIGLKFHHVEWLIELSKSKPIIYVLGNHCLYGKAIPKHYIDLKERFKGTNVHVLEKDSVVIDNVRFLGTTLWTDFNLFGTSKKPYAELSAQLDLTDFKSKKIKMSPSFKRFKAFDSQVEFTKSVKWLTDELAKEGDWRETVVVTHHAPSMKSVHKHCADNILSAAFASNLDGLIMAYQPKLWIHGHTHNTFDYYIGEYSRVICNPRGYASAGELNPEFNPKLKVKV